MTPSIAENIKEVVAARKQTAEQKAAAKKFIRASAHYKHLLSLGVTKPRGNNLLSKEKTYTNSLKFNTQL